VGQPLDASSVVVITVTAADGVTTDTYTVTVLPPAPTALSSLSANVPMEPAFSPAVKQYTIIATEAVCLTTTPAFPTATVAYLGASVAGLVGQPLDASSVVVITVTAADGVTTDTYTVTVLPPAPTALSSLSTKAVDEQAALIQILVVSPVGSSITVMACASDKPNLILSEVARKLHISVRESWCLTYNGRSLDGAMLSGVSAGDTLRIRCGLQGGASENGKGKMPMSSNAEASAMRESTWDPSQPGTSRNRMHHRPQPEEQHALWEAAEMEVEAAPPPPPILHGSSAGVCCKDSTCGSSMPFRGFIPSQSRCSSQVAASGLMVEEEEEEEEYELDDWDSSSDSDSDSEEEEEEEVEVEEEEEPQQHAPETDQFSGDVLFVDHLKVMSIVILNQQATAGEGSTSVGVMEPHHNPVVLEEEEQQQGASHAVPTMRPSVPAQLRTAATTSGNASRLPAMQRAVDTQTPSTTRAAEAAEAAVASTAAAHGHSTPPSVVAAASASTRPRRAAAVVEHSVRGDELGGLTAAALKAMAKAAGLAVSGNKAVLIARLRGEPLPSTTVGVKRRSFDDSAASPRVKRQRIQTMRDDQMDCDGTTPCDGAIHTPPAVRCGKVLRVRSGMRAMSETKQQRLIRTVVNGTHSRYGSTRVVWHAKQGHDEIAKLTQAMAQRVLPQHHEAGASFEVFQIRLTTGGAEGDYVENEGRKWTLGSTYHRDSHKMVREKDGKKEVLAVQGLAALVGSNRLEYQPLPDQCFDVTCEVGDVMLADGQVPCGVFHQGAVPHGGTSLRVGFHVWMPEGKAIPLDAAAIDPNLCCSPTTYEVAPSSVCKTPWCFQPGWFGAVRCPEHTGHVKSPCTHPGCTRRSKKLGGFCRPHGGGNRCGSMAKGTPCNGPALRRKRRGVLLCRKCVELGDTEGRRPCTGCPNSFEVVDGPIRTQCNACCGRGRAKVGRCQFEDCTNFSAPGGDKQCCIAHGGGRRCQEEGCLKSARGDTGAF
jgi:hypothetical protein